MVITGKKEMDQVYLVETGNGKGRILNADQGLLFPEQPVGEILKQGYWLPYTAEPGELERLLQGVEKLDR